MINFIEAQDEARQLTRNLKRDVEVKPVECDCDYSKNCGKCAGQGLYYELVFTFCGHPAAEDDSCEQCFENYCSEREQVQSVTFEHPPLRSLTQVQSERDEMEAEVA